MSDAKFNRTACPINVTAAKVLFKGEDFTPDKKILTAHSYSPFPTRLVPKNSVDLTGESVGRLTVIGLAEKRGMWVVRCDCGRYTMRRAKAIRNQNNTYDRCDACRHLLFLKRESAYLRTGRDQRH